MVSHLDSGSFRFIFTPGCEHVTGSQQCPIELKTQPNTVFSPHSSVTLTFKNRITYAATGAASTLPTLLYTAPFPYRYVVYADRHVLRLHTAVAIHQQRSAARPTLARATPPHRERTLSHQFRALDGHLKKLARPRTNNRSAVQFRDAAAGATRATPRQGHHMERRPRGRLGDRVDGI
jgi:hypothetical protein